MGVPILVLNQRGAYDLPALFALVRYVRQHRIDLIHTHLLAGDVMGRLAGFITRRPVISTMHSGRADLDHEPLRRQWLERWTVRLWCRRLIVVSDLLRRELAEWFDVPLERIIAIPNGVDTERFRPATDLQRATLKRELIGGNFPLVTNVARLVPVKGQRYLVEASCVVISKYPEVRFAFVGDGAMRGELEKLARDMGVAANIAFVGFRENVPDILDASDVCALSSLSEGMPLAVLEAMAAGCPVVATDVGGVSQLVRPGATGLLVPPADPQALSAALLELLDDPQRARQMGVEGRRRVAMDYSMHKWGRKLEELYLSELSRNV